jgi:hypothetical protein
MESNKRLQRHCPLAPCETSTATARRKQKKKKGSYAGDISIEVKFDWIMVLTRWNILPALPDTTKTRQQYYIWLKEIKNFPDQEKRAVLKSSTRLKSLSKLQI